LLFEQERAMRAFLLNAGARRQAERFGAADSG
jgi:hypothetical protein